MDTSLVNLQIPASLFDTLQSLAAKEQTDPVELIARLTAIAQRRSAWLHDLKELRATIHQEGGLHASMTKDDVVEHLRQTRREIFAAEYAHLYR